MSDGRGEEMALGATVDSDEEWTKVHRGYAVHLSEVRAGEPGEGIDRMVGEMLDGARAEDCVVWGTHNNVLFTVHPADDPKSVLDAYQAAWARAQESSGVPGIAELAAWRAVGKTWGDCETPERLDAFVSDLHTRTLRAEDNVATTGDVLKRLRALATGWETDAGEKRAMAEKQWSMGGETMTEWAVENAGKVEVLRGHALAIFAIVGRM